MGSGEGAVLEAPECDPAASNGASEVAPHWLCGVAGKAVDRALRGRFVAREDLVQEVLERVLRSLVHARFAHRCPLRMWIGMIARNVVADALRTHSREQRSASLLLDADLTAPIDLERQLDARSKLDRIELALRKMDPTTASVVELHCMFGHNVNEVAELTDLSIPAVQGRLARSRKSFRRELARARSSATPLRRG